MERGQILVVATVLVAVGLFGLRLWSDSGNVNGSLRDGGAAGVSGTGHGIGSDEDLGPGGSRAVGGSGSRGESGSGGGGGRFGASGPSGLTRGGTARAIGGADSKRGGYLGQSGSHRAGSGGSSVASRGDSGERKIETRKAARSAGRTDLVDFLGSQPPSGNEILGDEPETPDGEVALEVKSTEDTGLASQAEELLDPDFGDDGIKFTEGSKMTFEQAGGASGEAGTISLEIEPDWEGRAQTDNSLVQIRDPSSFGNRLQLVKNGHFLRFILADNLGIEADISVDIREWESGDLRKITASWGEGRTSLYIDGQLAGQNTYDGGFDISPTTPLHLGSDYDGSDYVGAAGVIRDFTLYTTPRHP